MSDIQTVVYNALVDHAPLLVGIALLGYKGMPVLLTKFFTNGGGRLIAGIVERENAKQVDALKKGFDERLAHHEAQEERRFREIEDRLPRKRR